MEVDDDSKAGRAQNAIQDENDDPDWCVVDEADEFGEVSKSTTDVKKCNPMVIATRSAMSNKRGVDLPTGNNSGKPADDDTRTRLNDFGEQKALPKQEAEDDTIAENTIKIVSQGRVRSASKSESFRCSPRHSRKSTLATDIGVV